MSLIFKDRVCETTATTGTGTYTLAGAKTGFIAFSSACSNADTAYYCVTNGASFEIGLGTYATSGTTLARTTILATSAGDTNAINWTGGIKDVFLTAPARAFSGPSFRAYSGSAQTVTSGAFTKIAFNTESYDYGGCYDAATNYRFQPNVPGPYRICVNVTAGNVSWPADGFINAYIYKNGEAFSGHAVHAKNSNYISASISDEIFMNGSSDYIEGYGLANAEWPVVQGVYSFMCGSLVRLA